jgi:ABC-type bacteriocin/lantibiotic exporter with double-glycine peptidase domain
MKKIKKFLFILPKNLHLQSLLLLCMILSMSLIDVAGLASILPFLALLTNPNIIYENTYLQIMYEYSKIFGVQNGNDFSIMCGIIFFVLLLISLGFKVLVIFLQTRLVKKCQFLITKRLVEYYLFQPYTWFLNRSSADINKTILSEVSLVVGRGFNPLLNLIMNSIISVTILALLFFAQPKVTILIVLTIGFFYIFVFTINKNVLKKIGKEIFQSNFDRFKILSEAFGAFKEIKAAGLEKTFLDQYSEPAENIVNQTAISEIITQIPRFIVEAIAFGGLILIAIYYMTTNEEGITNILPFIGLYAFAGYRLMPMLQKIYTSLNSLQVVEPALNSIYNDLKNLRPINLTEEIKPLKLNSHIVFKNVNFNYPNSAKKSLNDIDITIDAHKTTGLIGLTGSGKTTLVDMILGLLEIQEGSIEIDGKKINKKNIRAWQSTIGYVPQDIYLLDDTISANIAFGIKKDQINHESVEQSAKIANLHDFIVNELPLKYSTSIGEKGVRLSGGQRQRIGIARALYHKPQILILDEATSALDNVTEQQVMEALDNLGANITKILIAHRLTTLKKCDKIFLFDKGSIKKEGSYKELVENI